MTHPARLFWLTLLAPARLAAQAPAPAALSLEDALRLAVPASENLELARIAVLRARGEQTQAQSERFPQLGGSLGYTRLLASQFEGIDFGGEGDSTDGFEDLPFGRANTYNVGLSFSQTLFSGGRISGLETAADAGRRSADLGVTSAEAQLTLDVVGTYYDAVLADQQLAIAETALEQADSTLRLTQARHAVGTQPEFDVIRARVARDNQRAAVIQRRSERDLAHIRLKQLLNLTLEQPVRLTTPLDDTAHPGLTPQDGAASDTMVERRVPVRQATELVEAQGGRLRAARAEQLPSLVVTSQYGRVGYPENLNPGDANYFTNWSVNVGVQLPIFTGGRIRGSKMVAEAGVREAELRLQQVVEQARLDTRLALTTLEGAQARWEASEGTVEEATRGYRIAEVRFEEGVSTQTELVDARLALETARSVRAQAARDLQIGRARVALIALLPLPGASGSVPVAAVSARPRQTITPASTQASSIPGLTGIIP